ncbi:septation protein SpoVG family protein [Candidatus Eisenbacteria bacterium]|uniref:Septation protein SpoVG family protein n=1 Tax=Eiseniibacteriota bacterium TaxID=2212470 RepID=A0ABV6YN05_UNCEI
MKTQLSEIQITPIKPRNGLLAFASFILEESYYVADVAIHSRLGEDGFRLVYPMKILHNGAKVNTFHPIRKEVAQEIERQVSRAYERLIEKAQITR